MRIYILLINFNNSAYTINCIRSIFKSTYKDFEIHLLDNGSTKDELSDIKAGFSGKKIHTYQSSSNLGFAGGNNFLLSKVLSGASPKGVVLFLNNDTEINKHLLSIVAKRVTEYPKTGPIAMRMMQMDDPDKIDNLGLALEKTGLALNRTSKAKKLLGPSGGCAVFTVQCLKRIHAKAGDYFDNDYFCYAEDADLAWRAQLLGFAPTYLDDAICYHKGGATTGGGFNRFIMYHTLRNTLFNVVKNAPLSWLITHSLWIVGFQIALVFRYLFTRKIVTLLRVYKDFFVSLPQLIKKRRVIQKAYRSK